MEVWCYILFSKTTGVRLTAASQIENLDFCHQSSAALCSVFWNSEALRLSERLVE